MGATKARDCRRWRRELKGDFERGGGIVVESGQPKNKCVRCVLNACLE